MDQFDRSLDVKSVLTLCAICQWCSGARRNTRTELAVCKVLLGLNEEALAELGLTADAAQPPDEGIQEYIVVGHLVLTCWHLVQMVQNIFNREYQCLQRSDVHMTVTRQERQMMGMCHRDCLQ